MQQVDSVSELRKLVDNAKGEGKTVGVVATMGALHAGHQQLVIAAKERCDFVVTTIFVNPTQFNEQSDLDNYPKTLAADRLAAETAGADLLFTPDVSEVYPDGFTSRVCVLGQLTETLEGAHRGADHFHGVTTVVCKLFGMVQPNLAFFGQKDAQQLLVIRRMSKDLNMGIEIVAVPTVRDADGLALSSRNVRLDSLARKQAKAIPDCLRRAQTSAVNGDSVEAILEQANQTLQAAGIAAEYVALVDPETLMPSTACDQPQLLTVAAPVGSVRLIDNTLISSNPKLMQEI